MVKWQLSMSGHFDQEFLENLIATKEVPFGFSYEKGRAKMVKEPKENDQVAISCNAKHYAEGIILDGFHLIDGNLFATILVTKINEKQYLKGYRRNWTIVS